MRRSSSSKSSVSAVQTHVSTWTGSESGHRWRRKCFEGIRIIEIANSPDPGHNMRKRKTVPIQLILIVLLIRTLLFKFDHCWFLAFWGWFSHSEFFWLLSTAQAGKIIMGFGIPNWNLIVLPSKILPHINFLISNF